MSESGHFDLPALSMCRDPDIFARRNFFASGHFAQTDDTYILVGFRGSLYIKAPDLAPLLNFPIT